MISCWSKASIFLVCIFISAFECTAARGCAFCVRSYTIALCKEIFGSLSDSCCKHCTRNEFHRLHLCSPRHTDTHSGLHRDIWVLTLLVPRRSHAGTSCPVLPLCWGLSSSLMINAGLERLPAALHSPLGIQTP